MPLIDMFRKKSSRQKAQARQDAINKQNMHGTNRFFQAIEKGNLSLVKKLHEDGADIAATTSDRSTLSSMIMDVPYAAGATPLHAACLLGAVDIAAFLLNKQADPNAKDSMGQTPMDYALLSYSYYKTAFEKNETSRFVRKATQEKTARKIQAFETVIENLQKHSAKPGMFELPENLQNRQGAPLQQALRHASRPAVS